MRSAAFVRCVLFLVAALSGARMSEGAAALCYWSLSNDQDPDTGPLIITVVWDSGHETTHGEGDSLPVGCNVNHYKVGNPGPGPLGDLGIKATPPGCRGGASMNIGGVFTNPGEGIVMPGGLNCTGCGTEPADCDDCGAGTQDIDCDGTPNAEDDDIDGDGIPNGQDPDMDGDGIPNEDDPDMDGDGEPNDEDDEPCGPGSDPCECLNPPPAYCDDEPCDNKFVDHDCDGIPNGCDKQYVGSCADINGNAVCDHCECDPSDPGYPDCEEPCEDPPPNDHDCDGVPNECDKDYDPPGCLDANGDRICDHCQGELPPTGPDPEFTLPTAPQVDWQVPGLDLTGQAYEYDINLPWVDGGTKQLHVSTDPSDWGSSGLVGQLPMPSLVWHSMNTVRQLVRLMLLVMVIWSFGARFLRLFHTT